MPRLSVTWRVRLLNGLLSAGMLVALVVLAQTRIRAVLYDAIDRTLIEQARERVADERDPLRRGRRPPRPPGGDGGFFGGGFGAGPGPGPNGGGRFGEPPPLRFGAISLLSPRRVRFPLDPDPAAPKPWSAQAVADLTRPGRTRPEDLRFETGDDGVRIRVASVVIPGRGPDDTPAAVMQCAATLTETDAALGEIRTALYTLLLPLALVTGVFGALLTDVALAPVRRLIRAVSDMESSRDLSARLPEPGGGDTFDQLVTLLNAVFARLDAAFARQKRFTADASHELRTPLAVVKAATSLLLEMPETLSGLQKRALENADQAVDRANRLVADLLLLARTESGALPVRLSDVDLAGIVFGAVRAVEAGLPGSEPHARVTVDLSRMGSTAIRSDADHLHRLIVNLVDNAVRHTPASGTVMITVEPDGDGDAFLLQVRDTGEGIAPDQLARLGEAFYRPDAARARIHGGAGLGLALCKGIVAALSGTLAIESVVGEGTCVRVRLPSAVPGLTGPTHG